MSQRFIVFVRPIPQNRMWKEAAEACRELLHTYKVRKLKFTLEQEMKAQTGSSAIDLLFL